MPSEIPSDTLTKTVSVSFAICVQRLLDLSIFALIIVGFFSLAATGKLDAFATTIVTAAILVRGYFFAKKIEPQLSVRSTTRLTIAYAFVYVIDLFALSGGFIPATVHLVLFLLVAKLFSVHRDRDRVYLALIAFMMMLAAAILTIDAFYLGAFVLFSLVAVVAFIAMEMHRSVSGTAIATEVRYDRLGRLVTAAASVLIITILFLTPLLFFALPRVSAGRLSQFAQQNAYTTGFGDEVMLGQIGQIQQSDSVVMRAQFDRTPPADLKWHGVTLSQFDGRRWFNRRIDERLLIFRGSMDATYSFTQPDARRILDGLATPDPRLGERLRSGAARYVSYRVNLEPIGANLFFYPSRLISIRGSASRDYMLSSNAVLTYRDPGSFVVRSYAGISLVFTPAEPTSLSRESEPALGEYLELPKMDPRVAALARQVTARETTHFAQARAVEEYLRTKYGYTLEMVATSDPIPFFLFERKKGHCEYFASAMAVMLRTLGIPSRIVNGFRNGEQSDITGSYLVRGKDAHSWVEAYIPGSGWIEFDPTPSGDPPPRNMWARIGLYIDAAREFWGDWVINYDFSHQNVLAEMTTDAARRNVSSLWRNLDRRYWRIIADIQAWLRPQGSASEFPQTWQIISAIALAIALVVLWLRARKRKRAELQLAPQGIAAIWFARLMKRMSRRGMTKPAAHTARAWVGSVQPESLRGALSALVDEYEKARFGASAESCEKLPDHYEEIDELLKK